MKAILIRQYGGPEVLRVEDVQIPTLGPGNALVKIEASGVNFIDIYQRTGLYKGDLPFTPGMEAAGVVEAVGPGAGVAVGDRVAYAMTRGSYAKQAIVPASQLIKIPDNVSTVDAAACMLQGMTAHYLSHSTF